MREEELCAVQCLAYARGGTHEHIRARRLGAVFALTVFTGYVVCTVIWFTFMDQSFTFLNGLFHGLDFRRLYVGGGFRLNDWALASPCLRYGRSLSAPSLHSLRNLLSIERPSR